VGKEILYSVAKTSTGQLIKAADAQKGQAYNCLVCSQPLIFRKGTHKRPHFAHKTLSPNCTPETALHYGFKSLLYSKIQDHIDRKQPLEIQWGCNYCHSRHTGNLLKKAVQVKLEHHLGACQPDIALLGQDGRTLAVIEIIVTHFPEQKALSYYEQNQIAVVSYVLRSDDDINCLDSPILKPDDVDLCLHPKCPKCHRHMSKKRLLIIDAKCWKCCSPMRVAALRGDAGYEGDFSTSDIQLATQHGAFLVERYRQTEGEKYVVNTCRKCRRFIGTYYLFIDYVAVPEYGREELDAGYYCPSCGL